MRWLKGSLVVVALFALMVSPAFAGDIDVDETLADMITLYFYDSIDVTIGDGTVTEVPTGFGGTAGTPVDVTAGAPEPGDILGDATLVDMSGDQTATISNFWAVQGVTTGGDIYVRAYANATGGGDTLYLDGDDQESNMIDITTVEVQSAADGSSATTWTTGSMSVSAPGLATADAVAGDLQLTLSLAAASTAGDYYWDDVANVIIEAAASDWP